MTRMDSPSTHPTSRASERREAIRPLRDGGLITSPNAAGSEKPLGKINDETFRKTVLVLLLCAALSVLALASVFGPLMLDPFPPSAPPM
jgi:hypothetical protein